MGCAQLAAQHGRSILHSHRGMLNVQWDEFMLSMFSAPEETHQIEVVWGFQGGGSPNNPYLQKRKRNVRTYTDTVRPAQVAGSVLSIREELAAEWRNDLALLAVDNKELRRHHTEEVVHLVDAFEKEQYAIRPCEYDDSGEDKGDASPLRQASYDLLKNAATAEALRIITERLAADAATQHSSGWLRGFAAEHAQTLAGHLPAGRGPVSVEWNVARGVLLEMMAQPVVMGTGPDGAARFLDPLALADATMQLRAKIAAEWIAECERTTDEHLALARRRLEQRLFVETPAARPPPRPLRRLFGRKQRPTRPPRSRPEIDVPPGMDVRFDYDF